STDGRQARYRCNSATSWISPPEKTRVVPLLSTYALLCHSRVRPAGTASTESDAVGSRVSFQRKTSTRRWPRARAWRAIRSALTYTQVDALCGYRANARRSQWFAAKLVATMAVSGGSSATVTPSGSPRRRYQRSVNHGSVSTVWPSSSITTQALATRVIARCLLPIRRTMQVNVHMKSSGELTIGELANRFGLATHVLRHWESMGLLVPGRDRGGQRRYGDGDLARVALILMG